MIYTAKNDRLFKTVASNKYCKEILEALLSTIFNEKVEVLVKDNDIKTRRANPRI